jgi:hypothetical protein
MKTCDVMIQVDYLNDTAKYITDKVEFTFESNLIDDDCVEDIEILIENLIDSNEIQVDKRYIIIGDFKEIESYDWEYGTEYETYIEAKEIFLMDENIIEKYYPDDYFDEKQVKNE